MDNNREELTYEAIRRRLSAVYDVREAQAVCRLLAEERFGLTLADLLCGKLADLPAREQAQLATDVGRLEKGEPVQYVLGAAWFAGRRFRVAPGVLIPRPETEELCAWIATPPHRPAPSILDIGTGSGCIAVTLAANIKDSRVTAWDVSDTALGIAAENAKSAGFTVEIMKQDALNPPTDRGCWDVIVSNPPYICEREQAAMHRNVLDYEPPTALFVPDDDPLLFYRAIAGYAARALKPGGLLYFEINPLYAQPTADLLKSAGFSDVTLRRDMQGKERMVRGTI